ncbi:hypothetical protein, partial [Thiolapillus sp.]
APPQTAPLCISTSSGFLGVCAQVSGMANIAWVSPQGGDYTSPIQALNGAGSPATAIAAWSASRQAGTTWEASSW